MSVVKVYSNKFSDEAEHNHCPAGISFRDYLRQHVTGYDSDLDDTGLFSVSLNGEHLPPEHWDNPLSASDVIDVVIEPKGDPVTTVMAVIAIISAVATIRAMNALDVPDTYNSTTPDSSSIYSVNAQGNQAKLMGVVPILFGRHKVYPDYLVPSYRAYVAHEEWRYFMLSVCAHGAQLTASDVLIGDTPAPDLGSDISVQIFQPGVNVQANPAHRNMYSVAEVDGSGVEVKGVMPTFSYTTPWIVGEICYYWKVQGDTKKIRMYVGTRGDNSISETGPYDWRTFFRNAGYTDTSLIGTVIAIPNVSGYVEYFRCIEDSEVATFQRVTYGTWVIDNSWSGFGNENQVLFGSYQIIDTGDWGDYAGWFNATPSGEKTTRLEWDFYFPEGLTAMDDQGIPRTRSITVEISYRNTTTNTVYTFTETFTETTLDARAYTVTRTGLTSAGYQSRVRVTTVTHNKSLTKERLMWNGLRSQLTTASSYPFTTICLAIKGTQRLSSASSNKIACIATGKHPVLQSDLTWSAPVATRSVSAAAGVIAHDAGNTDDQIHLAELYRIGQILDARGDYFDGVFDTETTAWEALKRTLLIGWAQPVVDYGQILPVRDAATTDLGWQFSEQNMTGSLRESIAMTGSVNDKYDGVEVEYVDGTTWKSTTTLVTLPGQYGNNPEKLRVYGLVATDDTRATRYGLRHLRAKKYRNRRYEFQTEQDALEAKLYDPAQIGWAMPHRSQTGEVVAVNNTTLQLSEPVEFTPGVEHTIIVGDQNGFATGPYIATAGASEYQIVLDRALEFTPEFNGKIERPRYQFGPEGRRSISVRVNSVKPRGSDGASVVAVIDDPRVYADDNYGI